MNDLKRSNEECFFSDFAKRNPTPTCLPVQIDFETTSRCNLRCLTCRRHYTVMKGHDAQRDLFERMAEALFATGQAISLTGFGEPMLSPHFDFFFETAVAAGLSVGFITNGTLWTEPWLERFAAQPSWVTLSLDALKPETMAVMRPKLNIQRLMEHLQYWRALRDRGYVKQGHLRFNFVPTLLNIHELEPVVRLAGEVGAEAVEVLNLQLLGLPPEVAKFRIHHDHVQARRCFNQAKSAAMETGVKLLLPPGYADGPLEEACHDLLSLYDAPMTLNSSGMKYPLACSAPWFRVQIDQDGGVRPCCAYPFSLGNLYKNTFAEIWHGEPYQRMRRRINTRWPHLGCKECLMAWGIAAGQPDLIFQREGFPDRLHTKLQRCRRWWTTGRPASR